MNSGSRVWLLRPPVLNAKHIEIMVSLNFLSLKYAFLAFFCLLGSFGLTMSSQLSVLEAERVMFLLFLPLKNWRAMLLGAWVSRTGW